MMRSFENRPDTAVIDEPFYAAYLELSGIDHPLRSATLAMHESDWRNIVDVLTGPVPMSRAIFYQKHMTHHMLPEIGRDWMASCRNAFLIRTPEAVLASYSAKRSEFLTADIGYETQREIFDREAERLGAAPPVIDADDVLRNPHAALSALCAALDIPFSERMLHWPPGPRATDGAWAPAWYDSVERSTRFAHSRSYPPLDAERMAIADSVRPHYEHLLRYRLICTG
jgi:hypothetical protein